MTSQLVNYTEGDASNKNMFDHIQQDVSSALDCTHIHTHIYMYNTRTHMYTCITHTHVHTTVSECGGRYWRNRVLFYGLVR